MKVLSISLVLFVIAVGSNSAVNEVKCPEWTEQHLSESGTKFLPNPVDCSKFYVCVHSMPVEMNCPEGLWFDIERSICDYPKNVVCEGISKYHIKYESGLLFIISIATVFSFYILLVCQDISTMCKAFATPKNCANNGRVQRRCQKSCKRCRKYM